MVFEVPNTFERIRKNGVNIVDVTSKDAKVIFDDISSQALITNVKFEIGQVPIAIAAQYVADDVFVPGSEANKKVLDKFVEFHTKLAIYGDIANAAELNALGDQVYFAANKDEAVDWLTKK